MTTPAASFSLSLVAGASLSIDQDAALVRDARRLLLRRPSPGERAALAALAAGGADEADLEERALAAGGAAELARLGFLLHRLDQAGLLVRAIERDGALFAALVPMAPGGTFTPTTGLPAGRLLLSRFACMRRCGDATVLESPLCRGRLILADPRAAMLVHALGTAPLPDRLPPDAVPAAMPVAIPAATIDRMVALLVGAGFLESGDPALDAWAVDDLRFHARSRQGRHDAPYGGTFRLAGHRPPLPALRPPHDPVAARVSLHRPDLARLEREDPPLGRAPPGESRRWTAERLGEFLYRTARVTEEQRVDTPTPAGPIALDLALRPYPGGGALHELEIYPVVRDCAGLAPGLYHYAPREHRLDLLAADAAPGQGQLRLILTARFERRSWKYASTAYANVLKDVGVLYQTFALAARAMGLTGRADRAAPDGGLSSRLDRWSEAPVGAFLLGT